MTFTPTTIPDVLICEPKIFGDSRGYFTETFRADLLTENLHYQLPPFAQTKLVRVLQGAVLDIAVDMRKGSPTFGQHVAVELSSANQKQLFIPRGFAHGFIVLSDTAIFAYKVDNYYSPEHDSGVTFNDPYLNIDWQLKQNEFLLSDKDLRQPAFENAILFDYNLNLYKQ